MNWWIELQTMQQLLRGVAVSWYVGRGALLLLHSPVPALYAASAALTGHYIATSGAASVVSSSGHL